MVAVNLGVLDKQTVEILGPPFRHFPYLDETLACEQEMLRIEVAQLDESLSLLRAAARIRGIHQSALALHEVAQVSPRANQLLTEVVTGNVEQLRSDAICDAED